MGHGSTNDGERMNTDLPLITVVTVSYNQAAYLPQAIESVIQQDYPHLEYIVIDGASTDGSVAIIENYASRLAYWVSEPDRGQSEALLKGFRRASGNLLCWLNSDDIFLPATLNQVAQAYIQHNCPDVLTGNIIQINESNRVLRCIRIPGQTHYFGSRGVLNMPAPAIFFQSSLYEEARGLDLQLHIAMDNDLWFRFIKLEAAFVHIPSYLGAFRLHDGSKTTSFWRQNPNAFEHPESQLVRQRHWPNLSRNRVRMARLENKIWRMIHLDYLYSWLDTRRIRGNSISEVIAAGQLLS